MSILRWFRESPGDTHFRFHWGRSFLIPDFPSAAPPAVGDTRITELGDTRITENGDTRITG